jgi:hypothetical protein
MGVLFIQPHRFGGFTPLSVAGCQMWLDADDASSFTYSSGVSVSQWNDLSGNGKHVTQGTAANQPSRNGSVNGRTSVVWDGSNDALKIAPASFTLAQPFTAFAVVTLTGASNQDTVFDGDSVVCALAADTNDWVFGTSTILAGGQPTTAAQILTAVFNTTSSALYMNGGSAIASGGIGSNSLQGLRLGQLRSGLESFYQLGGSICEVIFYSSSLGSADRANVEAYLRTKWGTP